MKEQEIRKILAGKLREFRMKSGLTAREVGDRIGKSEKTVLGWEHGRGQPDADMLFILCDIYKINSIAEFYAEDRIDECPLDLSVEEKELISIFRSLNVETRKVVLSTVRGFFGNPDMQKDRSGGKAI